MKIRNLLPIVFLLSSSYALAQSTSRQLATSREMAKLSKALKEEKWPLAESLASHYMRRVADGDSSYQAGQLRYLHILSCAGCVLNGYLSFDSIRPRVLPYVGKSIVLGIHPVVPPGQKSGSNMIGVSIAADSIGFTTVTNRRETGILTFEYAPFPRPLDLGSHRGERAQFRGILGSIEFNSHESAFWIMSLQISDATIAYDNK